MSKLVQAGGTAKTTTIAALGLLLSRQGTTVHLVKMDSQAGLTRAFGRHDESDRPCSALADRAGLPVDGIQENLTLTPSTIELLRAETELLTEPGREFFLRTCLEKTQLPENTVVLLDCPPSLGR
jgi:chromosome partitioning protein